MNAIKHRRSMLLWCVLAIGASCGSGGGCCMPIVPSCGGRVSAINTTLSYSPEVACPGSTVTVQWDAAGQVPTITAPGGAVISNGQSAGSATFQATASGNITVSVSQATKTFPLTVISQYAIGLVAPVSWNGSTFIGQTPATFPTYDARFRATQLTTQRQQVLVSHLNGTAAVGSSPAVLAPPWLLNGIWYFSSGNEPTDNVGPSVVGVTAALTCEP